MTDQNAQMSEEELARQMDFLRAEDVATQRGELRDDVDADVVVGSVEVADKYRALPVDLGLSQRTFTDTPRQILTWARRLRFHWGARGYYIISWHQDVYVMRPDGSNRYRRLGVGDDEKTLAGLVQLALDGVRYIGAQDQQLTWEPTAREAREIASAIITATTPTGFDVAPDTWVDEQALRTTQSWLDTWHDEGVELSRHLDESTTDQYVPCSDGILWIVHDRRLGDGRRILLPASSGFFSMNSVPAAYGSEESDRREPGRWLSFLHDELWPGDHETVETLRQWFGYVLSGRTDLQKMLIVIGPPRSGKGVIAHVLTRLLGGEDAIASTTLTGIGERFGLANALGKKLLLIPDARVASNTKNIVERLLRITGEDAVNVDRKNKDEFSVKLGCRVMIMSNEMPSLKDASQALAERMMPLRMRNSFVGREDPRLKDRLDDELGGILRWALDGLDQLRPLDARFTLSASTQRELIEVRRDMSPVTAFLRESCTVDPVGWVSSSVLFDMWCAWVVENEAGDVMDARWFGRKVAASGLPVETRKRNGTRGWDGLRVGNVQL